MVRRSGLTARGPAPHTALTRSELEGLMETLVKTPHGVFFSPQQLVVPLFQRPYVWSREVQWSMLWEDVRRLADRMVQSGAPGSPHFLGAVVLQQQPGVIGALPRWTIIDGWSR